MEQLHTEQAVELAAGTTPEAAMTTEVQTAWDVWQLLTGTEDRTNFAHAYEGHYASRADFGDYLLNAQYNAPERLAALPMWLRGYVKLDGERFAADFERAGHYRLAEVSGPKDDPKVGVYVFDGMVLAQVVRSQA